MSQGGADRVAVLLANGFEEAGICTHLLLLRSGGEGETVLTQMLNQGVRVHFAGKPMGSRHLELVRGIAAIRGLIASARPSLVLASSSNMGLVTGVACSEARRMGLRVAMKLTNPVIRPRHRFIVQRAYRRRLYHSIFQRHDRVITLSDAEQTSLAATYPEFASRFATVPNAYLPAELLSAPLDCQAQSKAHPRLLSLARMMPQKRLDLLLKAFARMPRTDAQLTILGDGPLREPLENLARALGIAERVQMPGFVGDVMPAMRAADLFVLSSDYEGLPAALIEALACNVPVVTTDCFAGARAMIERSPFCIVTPVGDVKELAMGMGRALALGPPSGLRELVADYAIDKSIAAHIAELQLTGVRA